MEAAAITWRPPPVRFTLCRTPASIWSPSRFSLTSPPSSFKPLPISTIRATANSDQKALLIHSHGAARWCLR
uniref:Uncharacterized protein n=1 Tax=Kalanchoe fedtschenkoi TaxID=63787 RepID=A0A7N0TMN0_KALFE